MIRVNRAWLGRCSILALLMITFARAVTSYKTTIPKIQPYWADPFLAKLDRAIFGTDPWRLTHAMIGPAGTTAIDRIYVLWFAIVISFLGWFCFSRNHKLQLRGLISSMLCWSLLGNIMATYFASVGPCFYNAFYKDDQFGPLMDQLRTTNGNGRLFAIDTMDFLIDNLGKDYFGSGISAMPSLHVTLAMICFLASYSYSNSRLLKVGTLMFTFAILIGSVHLGWHYASDGLVGIVGATVIWLFTGRFVDWLEARDNAELQSRRLKPLPASS